MTINELLENERMTKYRLSKDSGVSYMTLNDICNGKTQLEKCTAETIYRISKALGVSMESLIEPCLYKRIDFELFKSNACHMLKEKGDIDFIIDFLENNYINDYYNKKWYPEALYLLAMLDYVSRENNIPLCAEYDEMRKMKLNKPVFPASVIVSFKVAGSSKVLQRAIDESIPEFIRFNIVESEVRNVI